MIISDDWTNWLDANDIKVSDALGNQGHQAFTFSRFVVAQAERHPEYLVHLLEQNSLKIPFTSEHPDALWRSPENDSSEIEFMCQLRCFRNFHMLWLYWRDLSGQAELSETCAHVSWLADTCIELAHEWSYKAVQQQLRITSAQLLPLIVIGMGKYGSEELNVSSDIDLIFCFTDEQDLPEGLRSLDLFYTRLGQQMIRLLDQRTADGFVFRVDMRLRPYGESGALVMSESALESYYLEQGRDWERFAFIKARYVYGTQQQTERLGTILKPFVFRRYIDFSVLESPREMKRLIQHEIRRRNLGDNIKLGAGGIREIEFITQALQLIHGGKDPELQGRNLNAMLNRIAIVGLLDPESVLKLQQAYLFLRLLEHRIQGYKDEQSQTVPSDPERQQLLALSMGYEGWYACQQQMAFHREQVHIIFNDLFASSNQSSHDTEALIFNDIWLAAKSSDSLADMILETGLQSAAAIAEELSQFAQLGVVRNSPPRAEQMLNHLMPIILSRLRGFSNQPLVLQRLINLILAIMSRTAYLELLRENITVLEQVMSLCDKSVMVAGLLTDYPFILDELLNPVPIEMDDGAEFKAQLQQSLNRIPLDDMETRMDVLREVRQTQLLRLCIADMSEQLSVSEIGRMLSEMASAVIQETVLMAWQIMTEKYGHLPSAEQAGYSVSPGFCVIAYGKLGGQEMGYGSDLDLVFVYRDIKEQTTGPNQLDNKRFYIRLAQKIIHLLSTRTRTGVLYEVDMRLRPSGNSGLLVSDIDAFATYQDSEAWTWEHQALIRARAIVGDPQLAELFNNIRDRVLSKPRSEAELKNDICAMRKRMQEHTMSPHKPGQLDLKQSDGALADIEFLSQYLVLKYGETMPDIFASTHTERLLQRIAEAQLLDSEDSELLINHYRTLRKHINHQNLQKMGSVVRDPGELLTQCQQVRQVWDQVFHTSD